MISNVTAQFFLREQNCVNDKIEILLYHPSTAMGESNSKVFQKDGLSYFSTVLIGANSKCPFKRNDSLFPSLNPNH